MLDGEALARYVCPSISVAAAIDDEIVYAQAFGDATVDTAYLLASVTKPILATAVCVAADLGLLSLDDPLDKHLPGPLPASPGFASRPTVRQALQHRAGFDKFHAFYYGRPAPPIEQVLARYAFPVYEPGLRREYSNLGYGILDLVLSSVTGQPLHDLLRELVFAPLGLTTCHIGASFPGPAPAAPRYTSDGRTYPDYGSAHPGACLAWGTASDIALFGLRHTTLLRPETATAMHTATPTGIPFPVLYGLGWVISAGPTRSFCHVARTHKPEEGNGWLGDSLPHRCRLTRG